MDTLGDTPTVVCVGRKQSASLPKLTTVLGRNASLGDLLVALERLGEHAGEARIVPGRRNQLLHVRPVALPDGSVHGAQVWIGRPDEQPPTRPLAGAWRWDVAKAESVEDEESFRICASPGGYRPRKSIAADLKTLVDPLDETGALGFVRAGGPGDAFDSVWTHTDEGGGHVRVRFSAHVSMDGGGRHVRGVNANVDIDPDSWQHPRPTMIAQAVGLAARRRGEHWALMLDPEAFTLWRWWNDPPTWLRDVYEPLLHPEDRPVLLALLAGLPAGRNQAVLRLMGFGGNWIEVEVEADLAPLGVVQAQFGGPPIANSVLLKCKR